MNRLACGTLCALSLLVIPGVASADGQIEVGGFIGMHLFSDINELGAPDTAPVDPLHDGLILGLRGSYRFHRLWTAEAELAIVPTSSKVADASVTAIGYRLQALIHPKQFVKGRLEPFGLLGIGGFTARADSPSVVNDSDFVWHFGAGAKYRIGNSWGVRLDLRLLVPPADGEQLATLDGEILIGVFKTFGGAASPRSERSDRDRDGIPDDVDACPDTPEDGMGAMSSDGCPDQAGGDADSDSDGISDANDRCVNDPETRNGFEDQDGCPDQVPPELQRFSGAVQGVEFATGSDRLTEGSTKILDEAASVLQKFPTLRFEISGHTDNQGDAAKNRELSKRRAEAVKAHLVKKGIDASRLDTAGYGPDKPLADNATPAGRAKNRRVEFKPL